MSGHRKFGVGLEVPCTDYAWKGEVYKETRETTVQAKEEINLFDWTFVHSIHYYIDL